MDNILQQSGNLQVDDDDDDVLTASAAQAICNFLGMCPTDIVHQVLTYKKVTFWKIYINFTNVFSKTKWSKN